MSGAWKLTGQFRDGLVGELEVTATRECGRVEQFSVRRFPAGWRCGATNVPKSVVATALRWARESGL
jgi:hypothetical protein